VGGLSSTVQMPSADAYPFPGKPAPVRFAVAIATVTVVFLLDSLFDPLIDDGSLYLLLAIAVMASAWFAGSAPALAATIAGAVAGALESPLATADPRASETHLALFIVQGVLLTALVSELRRARRVAEQRAKDAVEARRESEAAVRMKFEFLATVSHELRTPLNAVLGWLHLLRTGNLDSSTEKRGIEAIERNVRLQARLTGDLLDVSKLLTGSLHLQCRPVSLADLVRQAAAAAVPGAQAKGVQVMSTIPESGVHVLGDPLRLRQVVWHLLANAVKFTARGGTVNLSLEALTDAASLTVSDSGPGIHPDFLPRIFDRFTQQDGSASRLAGGLGVGLSLVKDLVELHGGEICARNNEGGRGALFTARLPLYPVESLKSDVPPAAVKNGERWPSPPLDGLRVLVFDQEADGRELLRTTLVQRGALVRTADSVADALEALEAWRPDVLVSDNAAPDHDSYALVRKVESLEPSRGGRIPAAALTSFSRTDEWVRQMLQSSLLDLPKPVEPTVLVEEIARLIGRERRRTHRE
jgi:signal transduction histidine kinase